MLKQLSEILMKHSRKDSVCTHSGGDEFILLLDNYTVDQVNAWYKRISNDMLREILLYKCRKWTGYKIWCQCRRYADKS